MGRPKKAKKQFNFAKPRTLDFSSVVDDNRFLTISNLIKLSDIKPWSQMCKGSPITLRFTPLSNLNQKISLVQGSIVQIKVDAIVNAAKNTLLGGGGIDKVIHETAGSELIEKCIQIQPEKGTDIRCYTGQCKVTNTIGCKLYCDYVFHTVGPKVEDIKQMDQYKKLLHLCYENCLQTMIETNVKSIAFPCISTGYFGYDNQEAAKVALNAVRTWLEHNHADIEQIIFCTYKNNDFEIYEKLMSEYFPTSQCVNESIIMNSTLTTSSMTMELDTEMICPLNIDSSSITKDTIDNYEETSAYHTTSVGIARESDSLTEYVDPVALAAVTVNRNFPVL